MGIGILLGISILFHLGAALLALRLIRITGSRTVWATIAVAVFSMGVRQSLTLYRLLTGDTAALDPVAEGVAFAISLLMFFGLAAIGPLFVSLRRTQDEATRFGRILEDSRNEIYLFDAETLRLIQVNRGARENLGYTMDELRQLTPLDLKPEFDAASFEELIAPLRDGTRRNVEFSTVHRRKDGSLYPVDVHLQVAADEPSPLFVAIVLDVTEAKEVEETLRLRDRAISSAPVGIVFTDPRQEDNPVIYANPAFERITGYSAAEAIGRNPRYLQGAERDQPGLQTLREAIVAGREATVEIRNRKRDGSAYWNELHIAPIRDESGEVTHFLGIQKDVTARKELEARLLGAEKMEAIGRLAGGIAHDFNNYLTIIVGKTERLESALPKDSPLLPDVADIALAADMSASLTRQLLAFGRTQHLEPRVLDLNQVIGNLERMLRRVIREDIDLRVIRADGLGLVRADPAQIEQVVVNLTVNARDAMPAGGSLTIETANITLDESQASRLQGLEPGAHVMLSVSDSGVGMDEATRKRIFDPFFTTKELGRGTGLGLASVHGIVSQSSGEIEVESEIERGTSFRIYLPCVGESDGEGARPDRPHATAVGGPETILLVEDEEKVRAIARSILEENGYEILEAGDAQAALAVADAHRAPIHLLLTDMILPKLDGVGLAARLAESRPDTKVLYMTGYAEDAATRRGPADPAIAILRKPFTSLDLLGMVRVALNERSNEAR